MAGLVRRLAPIFTLVILLAALWVLNNELALLSWLEIRAELSAVPGLALLAAAALTAVNYVVLTGYELVSLKHEGVTLAYRRVALASTLGFAVSQALGVPLLTGAPLRVRLYGKWGVDGARIARIIACSWLTFWVGVFSVGGVLLTFAGSMTATVPPTVVRMLGAVLLLGLGLYLGWVGRRGPELRIASLVLSAPTPRLALTQVALGAMDWFVAASVLFVLLPTQHGVPFLAFAGAFVTAQVLGFLSHVPGGLGVFEATLLVLMPPSIAEGALMASFVVYRVIYYLLPLAAAGLTLVVLERHWRRGRTVQVVTAIGSALPTVLSAGVFVLGGMLLLMGSVPMQPGRLEKVSAWLNPWALNVSHFVASLVGACMIVLARGLQRRLRGAYNLSLVALCVMAVISLVAFASPALSLAHGVAAGAIWASRDRFYRGSSLLDQAFTLRWVVAIGVILAAALWLGFFSFKGVQYNGDLWWRLTLNADAPRFLRASVGVASVLLLVSLARLIRATPHVAELASIEILDAIAPIVVRSPRSSANLALLGDKSILLSESGRSFVMYAVQGSSWVALGDPVGDESEFETLLWRFQDGADRAGDATVFYKVAPKFLHLYVDLGMGLFKLGEEGLVPLSGLTLEGKRWADLRQAKHRLERAGTDFVVFPRESVTAHLSALRRISDEWLESKRTREKGFSLGVFDEAYLARNGVAVVRTEGELVAFASLWAGEAREEFSLDLMRYSNAAPKGTMDYLFANLLLWGRDQGYRNLSLGMAPLAGLEDHRLAPFWHKLGDALFEHGERFYNFRGLHDFKAKFDPDWEPRYLAVSSLRHLPRALADVTALIAGGVKGVFGR